uniref:Uncharacterized protein n=1 Tax=viral metagenome TaxID=1070528 RepID=A0A6C0CJ92_9ZZZZ
MEGQQITSETVKAFCHHADIEELKLLMKILEVDERKYHNMSERSLRLVLLTTVKMIEESGK